MLELYTLCESMCIVLSSEHREHIQSYRRTTWETSQPDNYIVDVHVYMKTIKQREQCTAKKRSKEGLNTIVRDWSVYETTRDWER